MSRLASVPSRAHPLVIRLFAELERSGVDVTTLAKRAGVNRKTIYHWRRGCAPTVDNLEACLNALGCRLSVEAAPSGA